MVDPRRIKLYTAGIMWTAWILFGAVFPRWLRPRVTVRWLIAGALLQMALREWRYRLNRRTDALRQAGVGAVCSVD
jgi:hypothetical protein